MSDKTQVLYIHGGASYSNYAAFLEYMRTTDIDPYKPKSKRWADSLEDDLGEGFIVLQPSMPNKQNSKYEEWKIWFERHLEFLRDGDILVGWSQGGMFLVKWLIENELPVTVPHLYLLASPFEADDFGGEDGGDFLFDTKRVGEISGKVGNVHIFHSKDDFVVPYDHAVKLQAALPEAELITFEDRNHFLQEEFPELIEHIKAVAG